MKKLLALALLSLSACQTLPEPTPYDGKCYQAGTTPFDLVLIRFNARTGEEGDKVTTQAFLPMMGNYGEGEVPLTQVDADAKSGLLKEVPCPKNKQDGSDLFDAWHKEWLEFKAKKDAKAHTQEQKAD